MVQPGEVDQATDQPATGARIHVNQMFVLIRLCLFMSLAAPPAGGRLGVAYSRTAPRVGRDYESSMREDVERGHIFGAD